MLLPSAHWVSSYSGSRFAEGHPTITSMDLSNNQIGDTAGAALLKLVKHNRAVSVLQLDGTKITPKLIQQIGGELATNRRSNVAV